MLLISSHSGNNQQIDYVLALLSCLAYEPKPIVASELKRAGYDDQSFVILGAEYELVDTQCFVLRAGDNIIVVYRGTEPLNFADWLDDFTVFRPLLALPVPERTSNADNTTTIHGYVHPGFLNNLLRPSAYPDKKQVWVKVGDAVGALSEKPTVGKAKGIFFTGHSLGAGLAAISTGLWRNDPVHTVLPLRRVTLFGGPVIGDTELMRSFADAKIPLINYINGSDVVPRIHRLSLRPYLPGFKDWAEYRNVTRIGTPSAEGIALSSLLFKNIWNYRLLQPLSSYDMLSACVYDHLPSEYIRFLGDLAHKSE